ncbi:MAG: hypothetical protein JXA33_17875 [Anaerolineae bacterium]|nr:hypothetical protein [Anaerolineae bacterium]
MPGWETAGDVALYNSETIFNLVDGQADAFFAYGFEQVVVQTYENEEGAGLGIEVWQLATPADAYGLFTTSVAGVPVDGIGNEGDTDPGRRLVFWQDRYYVQVRARQPIADDELRAFAAGVAEALPSGGERPALVARLPEEDLESRRAIFFRQEISIQNEVWLGGENLLGLSAETEGVLAPYTQDESRVYLLLVQYPDADAAAAGLAVLNSGQVEDVSTAAAQDMLLGAVFGASDMDAAQALLQRAIK